MALWCTLPAHCTVPLFILPILPCHYIIPIFQHSLFVLNHLEDRNSKLLQNAHAHISINTASYSTRTQASGQAKLGTHCTMEWEIRALFYTFPLPSMFHRWCSLYIYNTILLASYTSKYIWHDYEKTFAWLSCWWLSNKNSTRPGCEQMTSWTLYYCP